MGSSNGLGRQGKYDMRYKGAMTEVAGVRLRLQMALDNGHLEMPDDPVVDHLLADYWRRLEGVQEAGDRLRELCSTRLEEVGYRDYAGDPGSAWNRDVARERWYAD